MRNIYMALNQVSFLEYQSKAIQEFVKSSVYNGEYKNMLVTLSQTDGDTYNNIDIQSFMRALTVQNHLKILNDEQGNYLNPYAMGLVYDFEYTRSIIKNELPSDVTFFVLKHTYDEFTNWITEVLGDTDDLNQLMLDEEEFHHHMDQLNMLANEFNGANVFTDTPLTIH